MVDTSDFRSGLNIIIDDRRAKMFSALPTNHQNRPKIGYNYLAYGGKVWSTPATSAVG